MGWWKTTWCIPDILDASGRELGGHPLCQTPSHPPTLSPPACHPGHLQRSLAAGLRHVYLYSKEKRGEEWVGKQQLTSSFPFQADGGWQAAWGAAWWWCRFGVCSVWSRASERASAERLTLLGACGPTKKNLAALSRTCVLTCDSTEEAEVTSIDTRFLLLLPSLFFSLSHCSSGLQHFLTVVFKVSHRALVKPLKTHICPSKLQIARCFFHENIPLWP